MKTRKDLMKLLTLGLFIILISCNNNSEHKNDEIATLLQADKDWAETTATNDAKRMVTHYDTAGILVYGTQLVKGQSDLETVWEGFMGSPAYQLKWEAQGAEVSGDLGFTYGHWDQRRLIGSDTILSEGIYLATWKKQSNGDWKVLIDKP